MSAKQKLKHPIFLDQVRLLCALIIIWLVVAFVLPLHYIQDEKGDLLLNGDSSANTIPSGPWKIIKPATKHQVEGYTSSDSVTPGSTIGLNVSCSVPSYFTTDIFRMGYYKSAGATLVQHLGKRSCSKQPFVFNPTVGMIDTFWKQSQHVVTGRQWQPGFYLARLTNGAGYQSYVPFVVKSPKPTSRILFVDAVATSEAYNDWGGDSLYTGHTPAASVDRGLVVSLNRPYSTNYGAGDFLTWEYPMIRYLERYGFKVDYATDININQDPQMLLAYKSIVIAGHDEYWTWPMLNGYKAAVDSGVNLAVFGANTDYRPTRIQPDRYTGQGNRNIACYKAIQLDPAWRAYYNNTFALNPKPASDFQITGYNWWWGPFSQPESLILGESFGGMTSGDQDLIVSDNSSWIFKGTGLQNGDKLPRLVGYEFDRSNPNFPQPPGVKSVFSSLLSDGSTSNSTYYVSSGGGQVFDAGTVQWSWGLDPSYSSYYNPKLVEITNNILTRFSQ